MKTRKHARERNRNAVACNTLTLVCGDAKIAQEVWLTTMVDQTVNKLIGVRIVCIPTKVEMSTVMLAEHARSVKEMYTTQHQTQPASSSEAVVQFSKTLIHHQKCRLILLAACNPSLLVLAHAQMIWSVMIRVCVSMVI